MKKSLSDEAFSFKVLVSLFLTLIGIGYVFGLINIFNNTGFSYTGLVVHYRGDIDAMTLPPEFVFAKLIHEHHVHLFGLALLFFLVGWIFTRTNLPEVVKAALVATPFIAMMLDFTSFWLLVFASPRFAWLSIAFGGFMAVSFFLLIGRPLYEMWVLVIWKRKWGEEVPWFLK
jgi:hypothetical protein